MARQTRSQRRARREAQQASAAAVERPRAPQSAVRRAPTRADAGERHVPGSGAKNFVAESWGELKKVEWPGQKQLIQGTVVVLVACFVVGVYLYGADLVFKRLVENVFLR